MKLFSLFRRSPAQAVPAPPPPLPEGVLPLAYDEYGFARPDWRTFEAWLVSQPEASHADWRRAADRQWLAAVQAMAPDRWTITPSQRFLLLHPTQLPERIGAYTTLLEKLTTRLGMMLPELARPPQGQMPVLIFAAEHEYQVYSTHYYPEYGEYGLSGGMFLAEGGGHIALPYFGFRAAEPVIAHELTHACLHHCALPRWLDEGLAVAFEHASYPRPRAKRRSSSSEHTRHCGRHSRSSDSGRGLRSLIRTSTKAAAMSWRRCWWKGCRVIARAFWAS